MTSTPIVLERALAVYEALTARGIDCAIGGALALGYHIDDPRGTQDIDLNVSLPADRAWEALEALPGDVPWAEETLATIARFDQVRIWWPIDGGVPMPLDLFFAVAEIHTLVNRRAVTVPMLHGEVRVLSATDLTIFKSLFDRGKDWVDIEAMLDAHESTVDLGEAIRRVAEIVGEGDSRCHRLARLGRT